MKRIFTFTLLAFLSMTMLAEHVDKPTALNIAKTILPYSDLVEIPTKDFNNLYIFTDHDSFVIVSADDRVIPVLGYSNEFPFVSENMPANLRYWMNCLNDNIQKSIDDDLAPTEEMIKEWNDLKSGIKPANKNRTNVAPLLHTHWNQYEPYNNLCPGGSVTGCTATAMAQLMKYWEWPMTGVGSHSYVHSTYGTLSANFGETTYDWDNMIGSPSTASTPEQQNAVATLMYHCGVAVDMNYSPSGSGAMPTTSSFVDYFGYNQYDIHSLYNYNAYNGYLNITDAQWVLMIKTELDAGRPVLYVGWNADLSLGHTFVCDGYDENDYLHINWGWGGSSDGYFVYGALNPGSMNFSGLNLILYGIHPNNISITAPTNLSYSVTDNTITLSWSAVANADHYKVYCDGFVVEPNVNDNTYVYTETEYGIITHSFYVKAVDANGICSLRSEELPTTVFNQYSNTIPTNLTATIQNYNNVHLNWSQPYNAPTYLKYLDEGDIYSNSNFNETQYYGQKYTSSKLAAYNGMNIISVQIYFWYTIPYTLYIYKIVDGEMVLQTSKDFSSHWGWVTVNLDTPVAIDDNNDIMIVYHSRNYTGMTYPCYVHGYNAGNSGLYSNDGITYVSYGNISWMMRASLTNGSYTYNIYRDGEVIANDIAATNYDDNELDVGTYSYAVKSNYCGGQSDLSSSVLVNVLPIPTYSVSVVSSPTDGGNVSGGGVFNEGSSVTVSAAANVGYMFDKWTENGIQVSTNANYTFTLNSDRSLVALFNGNNLDVTVSDIVLPTCSGNDDGYITVSASGGVPPYVYECNGQTSSSTSGSYTFNDMGTGAYSVMVTDNTGFSVTVQVTIDEPEQMSFGEISTGEESLCEGETPSAIISIQDATSPNVVTYRWMSNGQAVENSNTAQYTPVDLSVGTIVFTREAMDLCNEWTASEGAWTITVKALPFVYIDGNTSILEGESTTLTAFGAVSYLWNTGETTSSITVSPNENTVYSVVGTDAGGCTGEAEIMVMVQPDGVDNEMVSEVKMYPNPTNGNITVDCYGMRRIAVRSLFGQTLEIIEVSNSKTVVDLSNYSPGIYMLDIYTTNNTTLRETVVYSK